MYSSSSFSSFSNDHKTGNGNGNGGHTSRRHFRYGSRSVLRMRREESTSPARTLSTSGSGNITATPTSTLRGRPAPPTGGRNRSSSLSHIQTSFQQADFNGFSQITTTFSAENDSITSSFSSLSSSLEILPLLRGYNPDEHDVTMSSAAAKLPDFDLKTETDLLMNRTEELFGQQINNSSGQPEWVI